MFHRMRLQHGERIGEVFGRRHRDRFAWRVTCCLCRHGVTCMRVGALGAVIHGRHVVAGMRVIFRSGGHGMAGMRISAMGTVIHRLHVVACVRVFLRRSRHCMACMRVV
ncbi:hypothetical protein D3C81_1828820 [compost metagenome]